MRQLLDTYPTMRPPGKLTASPACGIVIRSAGPLRADEACLDALVRLGLSNLLPELRCEAGCDARGYWLSLRLEPTTIDALAPGLSTMGLAAAMGLNSLDQEADLLREILVCLLIGPVAFEYPNLDELESAVLIRRNIVHAARRTRLAFETESAERPQDCWTYDEDKGFTLLPGVALIDALIKTTQPAVSGKLYSFSCYRATEYVTLLGIAQELQRCNPPLLERLQTLWHQRAIMSEEFHTVFLREQGTIEAPLPALYFVPGDRVWFRNPDEASADATGFEGSWVMYLGGGLFTNFWKEQQHYTLTRKCVEIYHWRNGLYRDAQGEAQIDEVAIEPLIQATLNNPKELAQVMARMTQWREPRGVYTDAGGCMDTSREFARWVRPGTTDMPIPNT